MRPYFLRSAFASEARPSVTSASDVRPEDSAVEAPVNANAVAAAPEGFRPSLSSGTSTACSDACDTSPSFPAPVSEARIFRRSIHSQVCNSRPIWLRAEIFVQRAHSILAEKASLRRGQSPKERAERRNPPRLLAAKLQHFGVCHHHFTCANANGIAQVPWVISPEILALRSSMLNQAERFQYQCRGPS